MPLNKSNGEMYDWVSHTHSHLGGKCPHECCYCAIQDMAQRFPGMKKKYSGELRLVEKEFDVKYGSGNTIFVENCNDLFCDACPDSFISRVLDHCDQWPENTYVFQTKNPARYFKFFGRFWTFGERIILGTTIETNRPNPDMTVVPFRTFLTLEPILDFDVTVLASYIVGCKPEFVNLGADSKGHGLDEPIVEKIYDLVDELKKYGIELRVKRNLDKLKARQAR